MWRESYKKDSYLKVIFIKLVLDFSDEESSDSDSELAEII